MASAAIPARSTDRYWPGWPAAALAAFALLALLVNPIGYVGGGADDSRYLDAARCWVAAGSPCLPDSHWASRWPAVAPVALSLAIFGESRLTVGLGPLLAWAGCIGLLAVLGRLWFDRNSGLLAGAILAATPAFTRSALQPSVDTTELALQLGALVLATLAYRQQRLRLAVGAGVLAGLAVQARDTSLVFCGVAALAWFILDPARRKVLLWSVLGFVGVTAVEMLVYALASGDPLYRYRLAIGHVGVPTVELAGHVDTGQSPLFNPAYIAGWKREAGISLWWPVDPWINLLASPRIGATLVAGGLLAGWSWRWMTSGWKATLSRLFPFVMLVSALLVYGLAVDPKARVFLLLTAFAALSAAAATIASWRAGRGLVPAAAVGLVLVWGVSVLGRTPTTHAMETQARRWVALHPDAIEIDPRTRSVVALVPEAAGLPDAGSGRSLRIAAASPNCDDLGDVAGRAGNPDTGELCLLRVK